ncbi:MAG: pantetheine-phosphate adenylyltransferase [Ilumatobacteraceae bacterium]
MATVLIPGSFDPVHLGHLNVVEQAGELFGHVVLAVMHNPSKPSGLFTPEERVALARASLGDRTDESGDVPGDVVVELHEGLVVQAAERAGADFIVKGLRTPSDFEIEQQMAHNNHQVTGIRTVYVPCAPELGYISSRFVREIAAHGGRIDHLVAAPVAAALADRFGPVRGSGKDA